MTTTNRVWVTPSSHPSSAAFIFQFEPRLRKEPLCWLQYESLSWTGFFFTTFIFDNYFFFFTDSPTEDPPCNWGGSGTIPFDVVFHSFKESLNVLIFTNCFQGGILLLLSIILTHDKIFLSRHRRKKVIISSNTKWPRNITLYFPKFARAYLSIYKSCGGDSFCIMFILMRSVFGLNKISKLTHQFIGD